MLLSNEHARSRALSNSSEANCANLLHYMPDGCDGIWTHANCLRSAVPKSRLGDTPKWYWRGLNSRLLPYQSSTLPLSYSTNGSSGICTHARRCIRTVLYWLSYTSETMPGGFTPPSTDRQSVMIIATLRHQWGTQDLNPHSLGPRPRMFTKLH